MKRILSTILTGVILASITSVVAFGNSTYKDTANHWAKGRIDDWSTYGVVSGSDGYFFPNNPMSRGEFAVVLNKTLNYQNKADNSFSDLDNNFYTDSILKLNQAGVMQGDGNNINPRDSLTREQAAVMICKSLGIEGEDTINKIFPDYNKTASWAKPFINALVNRGIMNGSDEGFLNSKNIIKRAEVITLLDNAILPIVIEKSEANGIETDKILIISAGNVTIKDCIFNGDIIISEGVTAGEINFSNVKITSNIIVNNTREDFIVLDNCNLENKSFEEHTSVKSAELTEETPTIPSGDGGGITPPAPTPAPTQTQSPTQNPSENPTQSPTQSPTQAPTQNPTQAPTQSPSQKPTQTPGQNSGDTPTTTPTPTPTATPKPTPVDYEKINTESGMVKNLQDAIDDIAPFLDRSNPDLYSVFYTNEKTILSTVKTCMENALTFKKTDIIDDEFILRKYETQIDECKKKYETMENNGTSGTFIEKININLNWGTIEWLAKAFGVL